MPFSIFKRKPDKPGQALERGWQFYARPTTLEPVGFVFRIDGDGVRFPVAQFALETMEGQEAGVRVRQRLEIKVGVLARFLDLIDISADASIGRARMLEFEINDSTRVLSTDHAMEAGLKEFLQDFKPKVGNRYFVVRQTRSATSMTFRVTSDFLAALGGEGTVSAGLKVGTRLDVGSGDEYEIHQSFPQRLLVTFQPERIERVSAGLAEAGDFGLIPVSNSLDWREPLVG